MKQAAYYNSARLQEPGELNVLQFGRREMPESLFFAFLRYNKVVTTLNEARLDIGGTLEIYEVDTLAMVDETVDAIKKVYSIHSAFDMHSIALWMNPLEIRERLATAGFTINVVNARKTMLQPGTEDKKRDFVISYSISSKPKYSSVHFTIYAKDFSINTDVKKRLDDLFADKKINGKIFGIRWCFTGGGGMQEAVSEEIFEDVLHDEAYPEIVKEYGSIQNFVKQYMESDESILILQGPPGTGKTRLIRLILATLACSNPETSHDILYTGDDKLFETDGLFARFIIGDERALVVEDADHVLKPRANGNKDIHRFLATSDGLISSTGRKIIFSTNLVNLGDIDDALIRPGRCFGRLTVRNLTLNEGGVLMAKLKGYRMEPDCFETAKSILTSGSKRGKDSYSLAEIYKARKNSG